jgi:general secretion pathway protein D
MTIRFFGRRIFQSIVAIALSVSQFATAQVVIPPGFSRPTTQQPPAQQPAQQPQTQPPAEQPTPGGPAAAPPAPQQSSPQQPASTATGGLNLQNASLREVIDILARQLKINYILDPRVQGGVTINTYGETKAIDNRALLDTILRINGAAMIPQGDIYRIVPLTDVQRLPGLTPELNGKPLPEDDRTMLNLLFLKYVTADEVANVLKEFLTEHGKMWSYPPANLLMIQDSRRNMRRLMDLVALFDSDTFAGQRVRLFEVRNSLPSDVVKELEGILRGISLNEKTSPIKLIPVDRINTIIAVAPNPGVFADVETWLKKLDIAVTATAGSTNNFVYRVRFGYAPTLAMAIMGLYSNNPMYAMQMMMMFGAMGGGMGMGGINIGSGVGGNMMGGGMGMGMGMMPGMGMGMGMMPGMGMGMGGMMPGMGMGMGMMPGMGMGMMPGMMGGYSGQIGASIPASAATATGGAPANQTGTYLTPGAPGQMMMDPRMPKIIPNPFDNTLLIQATRQEYESILKLLRDIDIPPRQVLLEAKIYEVTLTGALSSGVAAYLQQRGAARPTTGEGAAPAMVSRQLNGSLSEGLTNLSVGALVGSSRELLAFLATQEVATNARVVSAPSLIATDSVPAVINVGTQVPTLTAQAVTGAQQGGSSLFANNISNRDTGVTLNVMARVNPSGIVTLIINQEVSAPQAPAATAAIQSPSFSRRTVQTQVTVTDGDTIAIGGIINETNSNSSTGIPVLHRVPVLGAAFGSKSRNAARTELIIFMTPRVIYDMNHLSDASDELKSRLRQLNRYLRDEDR